jgi:hypothetical protein
MYVASETSLHSLNSLVVVELGAERFAIAVGGGACLLNSPVIMRVRLHAGLLRLYESLTS